MAIQIFQCGGGRSASKTKCHYCSRPASGTCAFPVAEESKTCDRGICGQCTIDGACRIHKIRGDVPWEG
jgi:hypothetical protein